MERRRRRAPRADASGVAPPAVAPATQLAAAAAAISEFANIAAIVEAGGQIMIGTIAPVRGAALAHDGTKTVAMLRRRTGEPISALLARLDAAVATARANGTRIDEINTPGTDRRYEI